MKAFYHPDQARHDPKQFMRYGRICEATDVPARTEELLKALARLGIQPALPKDYGRGAIEAVHTTSYLNYLETAYRRWVQLPGHGPEVLPNTFPYWNADPSQDSRPPCPTDQLLAQTGYYVGDLASPIGEQTWLSALRSSHTATAGADALLAGEGLAYSLCRPSGHHSRADRASGFCYINNAAVAAQRLRQGFGKVAILDIDAHHGDGTQQIFYRRNDVLTVSVHVDPDHYNPFFSGRTNERGFGAGEGFNLNLPLAPESGDAEYIAATQRGLEAVSNFGAKALVVALGFDTHVEDPLSLVRVSTAAFRRAGEEIGTANMPVLVIQEGGYQISVIGDCLQGFLSGLREVSLNAARR
jgi:acetoin utilization deacetylase AcuC-like enzyme